MPNTEVLFNYSKLQTSTFGRNNTVSQKYHQQLLSVNGLLYLVTDSDSTLNAILVHFESRLIRVEFTIFAVFMHMLA